jgi:hypothetical protein
MRAERRLGECIRVQKETVGLATGGDAMRARFQSGTEVRPTLADAGIDKKLSSRAQKLAAVPEEQFERTLARAIRLAYSLSRRMVAQPDATDGPPGCTAGRFRVRGMLKFGCFWLSHP